MLHSDFREILSILSEEDVDHLVVGSHAVAAHGLEGSTGALEIWVRPSPENAIRIWNALGRFGASLSEITLDDFITGGLVCEVGVDPTRIDLMTSLPGRLSFEAAWRERADVEMDGLLVPVINRRHLAASKRADGSPQDLREAALLEKQVA